MPLAQFEYVLQILDMFNETRGGDLMSSDFTKLEGFCGKACVSEQPSLRS